MDVEAGLCQKASRIEEAITAVGLFIQRARLGLEPGFVVSAHFVLVWDSHFASYRAWEACKRRFVYLENWVVWDELKKAQRAGAFQFLESELRRAALTLPVPGGLAYWNGPRPPVHPGLTLLQHREPATMQLLDPAPEGLGLMGTPDRHARPSWLAPLNETPDDVSSDGPNDRPTGSDLPMWLQAAVRLGAKFIRVAAVGIPPATTSLEPKCQPSEVSGCCLICGKPHPTLMDE